MPVSPSTRSASSSAGPYSESYQTLQQCASDSSKFYAADSGIQLQQAFRDIGLKLSQIYLSK